MTNFEYEHVRHAAALEGVKRAFESALADAEREYNAKKDVLQKLREAAIGRAENFHANNMKELVNCGNGLNEAY